MRKSVQLLLSVFAALSISAYADPVIPYAVDSSTLQLWHLNETSGTYYNAVSGGMSMFNWGQRGTYGETSFTGLGNAWGGVPATNSNLQVTNVNWAAGGNMRGSDGAFTWEMVIRPDLAISSGVAQRLIQNTDMHLSLTYNVSQGYVFLTYWDVRLSANPFQIRLDSLGANAYEDGEWFHLAITYDGAGDGKVYWTALDTYTGTANQIGTFTNTGMDLYTSTTIGFGGVANVGGTSFHGAIDEIRISDVVRGPNDFLQVVPEPATIGMLIFSIAALFGVRKFTNR